MNTLSLASGLNIVSPVERMIAFCREEYDFYDGIAYSDANRIEPLDVLATVSVNSFINNATAVRKIQRGLADKCDSILRIIPVESDLLSDNPPLESLSKLLNAAVSVPDVLVPKATKVLHRKRRSLIPMLDNVVLFFYLDSTGESRKKGQTQDKRKAAAVAMDVLALFRKDLLKVVDAITAIKQRLCNDGFSLSHVRILEILVWTETEPNGYYRS